MCWALAQSILYVFRTIYTGLAASGTASQRHTTLCQIAIEDMDPSIRYCAFHLKMKGGQTMDIGELLDIKRAMGNIGGDFDGLAPQLEVRVSSLLLLLFNGIV